MYAPAHRSLEMIRFVAASLMLGAASALPFVGHAQTIVGAVEGAGEDDFYAEDYVPAGTVSCFDYYRFGSVQAKLTPSVASTVSGATVTFSGVLENANAYPVVDGALYVKIFRARGAVNDGNGPDVVDQFFVRDGIAIAGASSTPISFSWKVPAYAQSGQYSVATFFTTGKKFNLLGLSFTDDVVGNVVPFTVLGEVPGGVQFDKSAVTVNGAQYRFATFPPRVGDQPAGVQAQIRNTTTESQDVAVTWRVYQWDAQSEGNLIEESQTSVTVPAGGSAPVSIAVRDTANPVYLVVGEMRWKDAKSVIGVRVAREGADRLRLNFPSILSFPLSAGSENAIFSCLHNAGENTVAGSLQLTLTDRFGRTIAERMYAGDVTAAMMGVAEAFTPDRAYDYVKLTARLYQGQTLVDESASIYDCEKIDPSRCIPSKTFTFAGMEFPMTALYSLLAVAFFILMVFIGLWYRHEHKRMNAAPDTPDAV